MSAVWESWEAGVQSAPFSFGLLAVVGLALVLVTERVWRARRERAAVFALVHAIHARLSEADLDAAFEAIEARRGWAADTLERVLGPARRSAEAVHRAADTVPAADTRRWAFRTLALLGLAFGGVGWLTAQLGGGHSMSADHGQRVRALFGHEAETLSLLLWGAGVAVICLALGVVAERFVTATRATIDREARRLALLVVERGPDLRAVEERAGYREPA